MSKVVGPWHTKKKLEREFDFGFTFKLFCVLLGFYYIIKLFSTLNVTWRWKEVSSSWILNPNCNSCFFSKCWTTLGVKSSLGMYYLILSLRLGSFLVLTLSSMFFKSLEPMFCFWLVWIYFILSYKTFKRFD